MVVIEDGFGARYDDVISLATAITSKGLFFSVAFRLVME
jgi:hypothetical protein